MLHTWPIWGSRGDQVAALSEPEREGEEILEMGGLSVPVVASVYRVQCVLGL